MKRIIFIDDDPGIQDAISLILRQWEYDIEVLPNGEKILANDFTPPDAFIIDKQLLGLDGLDLCRILKNKDTGVPVIMISASPDIHQLAESAGADAAIEKPFKINVLKDVIARFLG